MQLLRDTVPLGMTELDSAVVFILWWGYKAVLFSLADWGGLYSIPKCPWGMMMSMCCSSPQPPHLVWVISSASILSSNYFSRLHHSASQPFLFCILGQVLGRKSPFPLILLPQFGGYWIEGTNHELSDSVESEQLQPLSPNSRTKLECNTTASIYRKNFLGKVSHLCRDVYNVKKLLLHEWHVLIVSPLTHLFIISE